MNVAEARRFVRRRQRASRTRDRDAFELGGGLNLVDPPATIRPGFCLAAENYEIGVNGGYERLGGFERFDGQPSPSAQTYYLLPFRHSAAFTTAFAAGNTVSGLAAGAATLLETVELVPWSRCYCAYSDDLGNAAWTATALAVAEVLDVDAPESLNFGVDLGGISDTVNVVDSRDVAPKRVWSLTEDSATSVHEVKNRWIENVASPEIAAGDQLIVSVFVKQGARRYVRLLPSTTDFAAAVVPIAVFDLELGTVVSSTATVEDAYIEDRAYGGGWHRLVMVTTALLANQTSAVYAILGALNASLASSYAGSGALAVYATGMNTDKRAGGAPTLGAFARSILVADLPIPAGIGYAAIRTLTTPFTASGATQGALRDQNGTTVGTWSGPEQEQAGPTVEKHLEYLQQVADTQRALINSLPGDGPVRGVWMYKGKAYGFRDDTSGSPDVCKMYESSSAGWVQKTFAPHLDFDAGLAAGAAALVEGATVNGLTSGATATLKRLNLINSNWAGSVAAGTLVLASVTGTFQNNETLRVGATAVATIDGILYTPTWTNGGRYRFRVYNFYGAADKLRLYGVNGLNRAFEYDSTDGILASIRTGMTNDAPTHLATHLYMLFLFFPGGSQQNSGIGRPANWTVVTGASEIALGDTVTDVLEEVGDSLFVFGRNATFQLTGKTVATFSLDRFDKGNGALEWSVQRIGMGIHLDDRGFGTLQTANTFGNYEANTFSRLIQPLVNSLLQESTVTASVIFRGANRYRCFFDDGRFVSIGVSGNKITGHMVCDYGLPVLCACSAEDNDGAERIFFGSDDGYVYEAERGTSFDGVEIGASLRPAYHHSGSPDRIKTYRSGRIEAILQGKCSLLVTPDLSFGKTRLVERDVSSDVGGGIWDYLTRWEQFNYDQPIEPLKTFKLGANGINIGLLIRHVSAREHPHTLRAIVYQSTLRGLQRSTAVG